MTRCAGGLRDWLDVRNVIEVPMRHKYEIRFYILGLDRCRGRVVQEWIQKNLVFGCFNQPTAVAVPGNVNVEFLYPKLVTGSRSSWFMFFLYFSTAGCP